MTGSKTHRKYLGPFGASGTADNYLPEIPIFSSITSRVQFLTTRNRSLTGFFRNLLTFRSLPGSNFSAGKIILLKDL
ncbi:MAG: hypothetical protein Q7T80_03610, partial [Methanoregula sp.]|nr:hypothetical protein [Methanoregula sp.]